MKNHNFEDMVKSENIEISENRKFGLKKRKS